MDGINRAIEVAGGVSALARAIGVATPTVSQWRHGVRPVSPKMAQAIERATAGAVSRTDLRPDVWPPEEKENRRAA
jgi:DNA-binding transcriptional regulator YdaS (Cro superfamily)